MKIALDVMGGDHAPHNNITGVKMALRALPHVEKLYLVGREGRDGARAGQAADRT